MNNCRGNKTSSSIKELYMINAQTYHALLNKLTTLERSEIDRLNTQPSQESNENLSQPKNSVYMTATGTNENNFQSPCQDSHASSLATNNVTTSSNFQSKDKNFVTNGNVSETDEIGDFEYDDDDEEESVLGEDHKEKRKLNCISRKRKKKHEMPHLVRLSTGPGILRSTNDGIASDHDQEENLELNDPTYYENKSSKSEDKINHEADHSEPDKNQCPVCFKVYTNSFTKIRHIISLHPNSAAAKQAWSLKKAKEAKNRSKIRLKAKAINRLNDNVKIIVSKSNDPEIKRGLKRDRIAEEEESDSEIEETSKKQQLEALESNHALSKVGEVGVSQDIEKSMKRNNSRKRPNSEKIRDSNFEDSEDETIPKENVTKSSTIAGKKRTKSRGENANDNKISRASAPKRKAKVVAMKALKGKRVKKSVRNTSKRLKLSKGGEDFEDTDDDEYDDWQN